MSQWTTGHAGKAKGFYSYCPPLPPRKQPDLSKPIEVYIDSFTPKKPEPIKDNIPNGVRPDDWDFGQERVNVEVVEEGLHMYNRERERKDIEKARKAMCTNFATLRDKNLPRDQLRIEANLLHRHTSRLRNYKINAQKEIDSLNKEIERLQDEIKSCQRRIQENEESEEVFPGIRKTKPKRSQIQPQAE